MSLVILAGVFISTIYFIPSGQSYTESKRVQIIEGENEWILQCDIINDQGRDIKYTIFISIDDVVYTDSTVVKQGKTYTYIHHIYPQQLEVGEVTFALYEDGKAEPVEQVTYHIGHN
ncbi:hypothetical protein ES703_90364 [subsurface metagenome]